MSTGMSEHAPKLLHSREIAKGTLEMCYKTAACLLMKDKAMTPNGASTTVLYIATNVSHFFPDTFNLHASFSAQHAT